MRSNIYLPSREDIDKHGQSYAIVDREAKRWIDRQQLKVEPRRFIEDTPEQKE